MYPMPLDAPFAFAQVSAIYRHDLTLIILMNRCAAPDLGGAEDETDGENVPTARSTNQQRDPVKGRCKRQVKRCEEPRVVRADEPLPEPATEIGDWQDWPFSLTDYLPSAGRASGGRPHLVIWHFQLPAS
jgi:hypothetical protein